MSEGAMPGAAEAQALVRRCATLLSSERVPLAECLGRVCAEDVHCRSALPPFDNSAMDGFALATGGRTLAAGQEFSAAGEQAAGDALPASARPCAIMTGARLPPGLDAVAPIEQVAVLDRDAAGLATRIRIEAELPPLQHVRRAGEDIAVGAIALGAGRAIGPADAMLLGGCGVATVSVRRRPRAAVLNTGQELVDAAGAELGESGIHNTNGPYLEAALQAAGAEVVWRETVADAAAAFLDSLERARHAGAELVVCTGAVSMGTRDFVPAALRDLGAEIVFHKVRMRPGKPLLFARLPGGALFFGLPGNPVSCVVGQRFFVDPALRVMLGMPEECGWPVALAGAVRKKRGFTVFHKAALRIDAGGGLRVHSLPGQESFRIRPLAQANAWAVLPEEAEELPAGTLVAVHALDHVRHDRMLERA